MTEGDPSYNLNEVLRGGSIIDNRRRYNDRLITLKDVIKILSKGSDSVKCAVGYFYLEGLVLVIDELVDATEIRILMGSETTQLTKSELISSFKKKLNEIEENSQTIPSILLFRELAREAETLKIRAYFGDGKKAERLHSKAYIFLNNAQSDDLLARYKAGIVGSSNLTPSGLISNTELNVILSEPCDIEYLESWFDDLWSRGSTEFEKLTIAQALVKAIDESKFKRYVTQGLYAYLDPRTFFIALIRFLRADYLFDDWKQSKLLEFQQVDAERCLQLLNEKGYRGVFLTSSVGLGKSYVAAQIAQYFLRENKKVLLIVPSGLKKNQDQWPRYLKELGIFGDVPLVGMGELQKKPQELNERIYDKDYGLIIVDEAHNYRNQDAYRTKNLKRIIDLNGNARILFLTATPINTSLYDLLNLIQLFHRPESNPRFDSLVRNLSRILASIEDKDYLALTEDDKEALIKNQDEIEKELFVKSTRETIKMSSEYIREVESFSGVNLNALPDPEISEIAYKLDEKYKPIVDGIVDFITGFRAAHLKILDPEKGVRLGGFFKWMLYNRFESDISSYYLTLKRLLRRNELILRAIETRKITELEREPLDEDDEIDTTFSYDFKEKLAEVIEEIKRGRGAEHLSQQNDLRHDISSIRTELGKLAPLLCQNSSILFKDDRKLAELLHTINSAPTEKFLIFTQYKDTQKAIREFLEDKVRDEGISFIDSATKKKEKILSRFNDAQGKLRILVTTDTLSEGYNISGADTVVNFDIPFNPVRLIQRIGRSTRLDSLKKTKVCNFKPDKSIDKELKLVAKLQIRIEDIIKWVGIEYRIWFDEEKKLLEIRRQKDRAFYLQVLENIRKDERRGKFVETNQPVSYTRQALLRHAISKYTITREDVGRSEDVLQNGYTLLTGARNLVVFHREPFLSKEGQAESYNETSLSTSEIEECDKPISFESVFRKELAELNQHLDAERKLQVTAHYYTSRVERERLTLLEKVRTEELNLLFVSGRDFETALELVPDRCGSTTERNLKEIAKEIKKNAISDQKLQNWTRQLTSSFARRDIQRDLDERKVAHLAIGFLPECL